MQKILVKRSTGDGRVALEIRFKALSQLLDQDDHTPLPDQELAVFAEETLAGYLDEYPVRTPMVLRLLVPESELAPGTAPLVAEAVKRHFSFRLADLEHEQVVDRREGRYSFIIATINMAIAVVFVYLSSAYILSGDVFFLFLSGLVTILNWVTVWDTYEYYMYDYRNLLRKHRIYQKMTRMPVTVSGYASREGD